MFRSWWQKIKQHLITILIVAIILVVVIALIIVGYRLDWTGFNGSNKSGKTLWDWLQLLIIPAVLAITALLFNMATSRNEQRLTIQRDKTAFNLAVNTQREDRLQAYLDKMSELLLTGKLRKSGLNDEARYIARARTLTVLSQLDGDGERKKTVLQFLYESNLIKKSVDSDIVSLEGADLSGGDYSLLTLQNANLHKVFMVNVTLDEVDLSGTDISNADLSDSNFANSNLSCSNLRETYIQDARLENVDLHNADISHANLTGSDLTNANISGANLNGADLGSFLSEDGDYYRSAANLINANLSTAILTDTDLTEANLTGANLSKADLRGANLTKAKVTEEQWKKAKSLKGATMPDGSKHP
jgi:uncharacterized protein YjbI with pentapeptide repeats